MRQQVVFLIITTVLLASCQHEREWEGAPDIKAKVESEKETRTSLSVDESGAGTIYWNPSDKIDVFFGTKKVHYTSQNTSDATIATFKTSESVSVSDVSSTIIWGLYPSNSTSNCDGSSVKTTLPAAQKGVPGTFDDDLFIAAAHSTTSTLQFKNVCGSIRFSLYRDDIVSVVFKGNDNEDIAGDISISFVGGVPVASVVNGVKEITLTPKTGATFAKDTFYHIVALPATLTQGFTMTFTTTSGATGTFNFSDKPIAIKRSTIAKKPQVDIYTTFSDGAKPNNVIYYTSEDGYSIDPASSIGFDASVLLNEYVNGCGILSFSGTLTRIDDGAFQSCKRLSSVIVPNSVKEIDFFAFYKCSGLTSIELSRSLTKIGQNAFNECSSLESVTFPESISVIGFLSFQKCKRLTSIIIPSGVKMVDGGAFSGCDGLISIHVANNNPKYDSRDNCNAIIETESNCLISGCKRTVIPNSVNSIGEYAFQGLNSLTTIEIPNSVTSIGNNAFGSCSRLASIRIPESVTSIGGDAFRWCTSLSTLEIPKSVERIGREAFYQCAGLTEIIINAAIPPTIGDNVFMNTNACPIYVPFGSADAYKAAWSEYAERIQEMPDPHEAVDLGLSVKWATCNLGASAPEEFGVFFAWGETEPKDNYDWFKYKWCNGSYATLTRYNTSSSWGTLDNKTEFADYGYEDDAVRAKLGGKWRMPTDAEWTELRTKCSWTWTEQNSVKGRLVTASNGNSIFLPAAGYWYLTSLEHAGSLGIYWSSSLHTDGPYQAWGVGFDSDDVRRGIYDRYYGVPIRPVSM